MKVSEHLANSKNPFISFEIIPPLRGGSITELFELVDELVKHHPPFIDVTSHSAEVQYEEIPDGGIKKRVKRKRPGTIGLSVAIKNKYNIDTVPHILCRGFTKEETEDALIELNYLGIENVLAVQGDDKGYKKPTPAGKTTNEYADELVEQINNMNKGHYLESDLLDATPTNFCIGVAGYPEKHYESPNMKADMEVLKSKIKNGAHYCVTQMFYKNEHYFNFVDQCRKSGINIPVIPGLKILTSKKHLTSLPKDFFIDIPEELYNEVMEAKDRHIIDIGVEWACKQVEELLNRNAPAVHFYILQNAKPVNMVFTKLKI
ncbi:MAG: methylenetetrahydrofolate reductase [Bacteroidetes bacterium]|nr:methylenetetrahydrofolate reductase [Bacteroidota bacterium]